MRNDPPARPARTALIVTGTALLTGLAALLVLNLQSSEKRIERQVRRLYGSGERDFTRAMGALLGPAIVPGNRIDAFQNGDEIFPAMLEAIDSAQETITFETFIYWSGDIGRQFAAALAARARAGVAVHVLLDWVGSRTMNEALLAELTAAGVEVNRYHPLHWYHLGRMNNRTHRKLLVIDGRIGFTGGVGIAQQWTGHAQDPQHWRDSHYRVRGPVVAQIQAAFLDNWIKTTGRVMHGPRYFPALEAAGESSAQMFSSSPTGGSESMHLMYLLAITAAERSIDLSISYFVPDQLIIQSIVDACNRGVRVRIIVPGRHIDQYVLRKASRSLWGPLLRAGVEIHEYLPTMFHCKGMIVDEFMVSVGSTNFDNRSFRLNDEANLNIYDAAFAAQVRAVFETDLARSRRITLRMWERRPLLDRVLDNAATVLRPQL